MRGCMRVLAFLTAIVFVITAVANLFLVNLARVVTDRQAVTGALNLAPFVENTVPVLLADRIREQDSQLGLPLDEVDPAVFRAAIDQLIPPGWLDMVAKAAVDGVFDFLQSGDVSQAVIAIDVRPVLAQLRGEPGRQAVLMVLQSLPVCTDPLAGLDLETGQFEFPGCVPPGIPVPELAAQIHQALVETLDVNPQLLGEEGIVRQPLFPAAQLTPAAQQQLLRLQRLYTWGRWSWLLWFVPLGCLFLILLLAVRSLSSLGHWWGWPLLAAAVLALFFRALVPALMTAYLRTAVIGPADLSASGLPVGQLMRGLVDSLADLWLGRVTIQALIMLGVGLLLVLLGFGGGRRRDRSEPTVTYY